MTNKIKVPEAVLERFKETRQIETVTSVEHEALENALEQFCEELLENKAQVAAFRASGPELSSIYPPSPEQLRRALKAGTQAAIHSVTGGDNG